MGREFECKYRADPEVLTAIEKRCGNFEPLYMEAAYYDTADHALQQRKWMLRLRRENGICLCTLKTPLPDGSRGEWEVRESQLLRAIPALIFQGCPAELEALSGHGLIPVCAARYTRLAKKISWGNSIIELALDQGAFLAGEKELPFCEVEAELKSGTESDCCAFAQALADAYGLSPEPKSKAQRAFALALDA